MQCHAVQRALVALVYRLLDGSPSQHSLECIRGQSRNNAGMCVCVCALEQDGNNR